MSANISFLRTAASCTPFVGPFVGLYNVVENRLEIDQILGCAGPFGEMQQSLQKMRISAMRLAAAGYAISGSREGLGQVEQQLRQMQREETEKLQRLLPVLERRSVYSKCGIAASVLTVAAIVTLFALGIFTGGGAIFMSAAFGLHVAVHSYNLYRTHKDIRHIHTVLAQPIDDSQPAEEPRTA